MRRILRLLAQLLLPPFLGGCLFLLPSAAADGITYTLSKSRWLLTWAYVLGIGPSLAYAFIMDWSYRKRAPAHTWRAVWLSSLLGALAGAAIGAVAVIGMMPYSAEGHLLTARVYLGALYLGGMGALVGFALGVGVKVFATVWSSGND